jgi:hypothetical protein
VTKAHEWFCIAIHLIVWPFRPGTWRFFLFRQTKVRIHLKGGSHVDVYCQSWEANLNGGNKSYKFIQLRKMVSFDAGEIVGVEQR